MISHTKKDKEYRNSWGMALKLLDMWKAPMFTVVCLGTTGRYVSHRGWGVKTSLMTMTLCSERTLLLKNKSVGNKVSLDLLFGEQFVFDIVMNRTHL